jgi:molybdopterin molybdotransferase
MVSVEEASAIVLSHPFKFNTSTIPFQEAVNRVLAERIVADRDFPPFNRVSMDGVALLFDRWKDGQREFVIEGVQPAGLKQGRIEQPDQCMEVMTGAVLPDGADTVVRYEDMETAEGVAIIKLDNLRRGQNVHHQGTDRKAWNVLLEPGTKLTPAEIALLASVGKSKVDVFDFPPAAIVSTGDELVEVEATPLSHQVRRSNTFAIQAAMRTLGWKGECYHLPDDQYLMQETLTNLIAAHQVIIVSGGVSKGKFDYVPEVLAALGVSRRFQGVRQKPGKPFWFGTTGDGKTVFALPGNPVSTFLCFYRFIKPWLFSSLGSVLPGETAVIDDDFTHQANVTYFLPVALQSRDGKCFALPLEGSGSGDFANLKDADGFLEIPLGKNTVSKGEVLSLFRFRT